MSQKRAEQAEQAISYFSPFGIFYSEWKKEKRGCVESLNRESPVPLVPTGHNDTENAVSDDRAPTEPVPLTPTATPTGGQPAAYGGARHKPAILAPPRHGRVCPPGAVPDPKLFEVPDGWSPRSWIERLEHLASICTHANRAAELQDWADGLRAENQRDVERAANGGPLVRIDDPQFIDLIDRSDAVRAANNGTSAPGPCGREKMRFP